MRLLEPRSGPHRRQVRGLRRRWRARRRATFVTLEDWANDGPPVAGAAAREMFEGLFARRSAAAPAHGASAARSIDPGALGIPLLNIVSTTDRIVPAATAPRAGERLDLALGHVGMVVGSRAPGRCCGSRWRPGFPALQQAARAQRAESSHSSSQEDFKHP